MSEKALLTIGDKTYELPVITGTEGEQAIDITKLRQQTGLTTYDPSFGNTASCKSAITFIDGEKGILRYRGIPIEQLAENPDFAEVAWLLIFGRLPNREELDEFSDRMTTHELIHEGLTNQYYHLPPGAPPMAILSASLSNLACYLPEFLKLDNHEAFTCAAARMISKVRTMAAFSYRHSRGLPFAYPNPNLRYSANFLHMMFSLPYKQFEVKPEMEDALNLFLLLHADHEQNCSASTVRVVGSARANLFSSCAAGVGALWGPLHGGANVEVIEMLQRIHDGGVSPAECIRKAKEKDSDFRLYGFGHRVYKNYDPRARILQRSCERLFATLHRRDPLLDSARKLEELALEDPYFTERKLYPNVDFYSGMMLRALQIPLNMFTVLFAMGRLPGWIAQWKEQYDDETTRIARPRQVYVGPSKCDYVPIDQR